MNARIHSHKFSLSRRQGVALSGTHLEEAEKPGIEEGIVRLLPELRRRACQLTRDPRQAEDLTQDAIERALRFKSSFQPGGHLRAWIFRIMQNVFISQMRRRTVERRILEGAGHDPNGWANQRASHLLPGLSPPVEKELEKLPERLREVVRLVDLHDFSYQDAALAQEVPIGTIMSRLHRGRARLALGLAPVAAA